MTDDLLYQDILARWNALADAVEKLYFAGYWHCDRPVDEQALWQAVRDAAKIPPGMTAYTLGEERTKQPEERRTGCAQYETCPHGYSTRSACGACGQPTAAKRSEG
jgi:hypothetical protein